MQMPALFAWPATRHLKPRPFNIIPAIRCTAVIHFCNENFHLRHFFGPIWTSLLTCDWAKLNAVISLQLGPGICVKKFSCPLKNNNRENWDKLSVYFSIFEWWNWPKHKEVHGRFFAKTGVSCTTYRSWTSLPKHQFYQIAKWLFLV